MNKQRRRFLKLGALTGLGLTSAGRFESLAQLTNHPFTTIISPVENNNLAAAGTSLIGGYGEWAAGLFNNKIPTLSFRNKSFADLNAWKIIAKQRLQERLAVPFIGPAPKVSVKKKYTFDGLDIEELNWQLPYGRPTDAILLKPAHSSGKLPAILAFHDHGGNKYFGTRKITKSSAAQHPLMKEHQQEYYEGMAWANEIAKRGYVVLVADAFPFASRRVMLQDVPEHIREGLNDGDPENPGQIAAYNKWAGEHEHIMAKSLFSAGTTWPGVFFAEDRIALDILESRPEVDPGRMGCAGLSGGGMRTVFMAGQDERIKCAVCVGFMTTWKDFVLNKSFTHTWMTYVPVLPQELDFPEILGLRVPLPTLVLNDQDDDLYTLSEMKAADQVLMGIYAKANATDRYHCSYYPGPHKFDKAMQKEAFTWFDKWLKE